MNVKNKHKKHNSKYYESDSDDLFDNYDSDRVTDCSSCND